MSRPGGRKASICLAQVGFRARHIDDHVEHLKKIISDNRAADLIVLPELILHGHPTLEEPEGFLYRQARVLYGPVSSKLYAFIRELDARVIFGEIRRRVDLLYNVATYVDRQGSQHYVKSHVHWSENFVAGRRLEVFDTPLGPVGISICFDAAFPEVWRALALRGAELLVNISAVPADFSLEVMRRRMQGAAVANQAYVVYVNRPGPRFSGHSAVFDPCGEQVAGAGPDEWVTRVEIDLERVTTWREEEPVYGLRRPQLYRSIASRADQLAVAAGKEPRLVRVGGFG